MSVMTIEISKIRIDGGTQSRAELNKSTVDEYAASMFAGDTFPAVKVFYDGKDYWLADGFHRVAATTQLNATVIQADVHQGTQRDAVLDSVGANAKHGLRRSREDMRRAINTLLNDEQWRKWSDREIGRKCGCDHKTVASERAKLSGEIPQMETRTVERNGVQYEMTPAAKPSIVNSRGRGFEIGDAVRISDLKGWDRRYGQIASIEDEEDVVLDFVMSLPRTGKKPETVTVSRLMLFPISEQDFAYWYRCSHYEAEMVIYPWKDHYITLDRPRGNHIRGYNWKTEESWNSGSAWRLDPSFLDYWTEKGISYEVVKPEDTPQTMQDVINKVGRARGPINLPQEEVTVFKIGELISYRGDTVPPRYRIGLISRIDEAGITLERAVYEGSANWEKQETCLVPATAKPRLATLRERIDWFCWEHRPKEYSRNPETMVLFEWEHHFLLFNTNFTQQYQDVLSDTYVVGNMKVSNFTNAWRIDPSFVEYWREQGHTAVIVSYNDLLPAIKEVINLAGSTRAGVMNMRPLPEAVLPTLADHKTEVALPNEEPIASGTAIPAPLWVQAGTKVKHTSGKICEIQRAYVSGKIWMLRVEVIKPEEGFADAPVSEFDPVLKPGTRMLHYGEMVEMTSYQRGTRIDVRGVLSRNGFGVAVDRLKEISESVENGRQYRLKTNGNNVRVIAVQKDNITAMIYDLTGRESLAGTVHEYTVLISDLERFPAEEMTLIKVAPTTTTEPTANPILNEEQLKALEDSVKKMFTFLELRLLPDKGDLSDDLERVYQAMHTARNVYYKMRDPATGRVKA